MKILYTAVGRFKRQRTPDGTDCPLILLGGKEYLVDLQELMIWTSLNWRITRMDEIGEYYRLSAVKNHYTSSRTWEVCVNRLLTRGLLVSGSGETDYDALYDLLSSMYIIHTNGNAFLRIASFLKLTLVNRISLSVAVKLFRFDRRTEQEKQVMKLSNQALLSTAEIIRCVEKNIGRLYKADSIMESIYGDSDITSDNITDLVKASSHSQEVTLAVANLYLRQQVIFERV